MQLRRLFFLVMAFSLTFVFQNCSEMQFTKVPGSADEKPVDNELEVPDDDTTDDDTPPGGGDDDTTPTPSPTPIPSPTVTPGPTPPGATPTPGPTTPPGRRPPPGDDDDSVDTGTCRNIDIAKVLINVNHVELSPSGVTIAVPADTVIDLLKLETTGFTFGPVSTLGTIGVHQVRLVLNNFGNKLVSDEMEEVPLKTPSAQNSGLKFLLPHATNIEAGKSYTIKAAFDPSSRIVRTKKKCILKPVIKVLSITEVIQ